MTIIDMDKMGEALNTKADIDLNNTGVFSTSEGGVVNLTSSTPANASGKEVTSADFFQSNLLNYTTNRILEIPQDIKLELNNGTLTLKAGSKLYVPNGFEADGTTPKFDEFITSNDIVDIDFGNDNKEVAFLITKHDATQISVWNSPTVVSGTSAPDFSSTGYWGVWYDTSNNIIKNQAGTNVWKDFQGFSLPFCLVSSSSSAVTSIDQVFNGFGYIGSTVFALPGVKVQTPNGKNADGTYKSVIRTIDSVRTYNASWWGTRNLKLIVSGNAINTLYETQAVERFTYNKKFSSDTTTYSYDENTGMWWYSPDQSSWLKSALNILGSCRIESGRITSFESYTVDSILNSSLSNLSPAGEAKLKSNIQLVNELPANPEPGVLYCIPEA